jgi:DUF4097 and DUF4098 domain-containing protein YvlB
LRVTFARLLRLINMPDRMFAMPAKARLRARLGASFLALCAALCAPPAVAGSPVATATRTDRLSVPGPVTALDLSVISGDVRISAGAVFAATIELKAGADDQASAAALLARTKVDLRFEKGEVKLEIPRDHGDWRHEGSMVEARYAIVLPAGAAAKVRTVNAATKIEGIAGPVTVDAVNGPVEVSGVKKDLHLRSVNGKVDGRVAEVAPGAKLSADTVNGSVVLWLPASAQVRLSAQTLNGEIVSTLPLPPQTEARRWGPPHRSYHGAIGAGGAEVNLKSVNGRLALLATGSSEAQAKPLVVMSDDGGGGRGEREARGQRGFSFRISNDGNDVRRDQISGDFVYDSGSGDVRVEAVAGLVKVKTSGDVRIGSVAKGAEVFTAGGDIRLDSVKGALQARSGGGDVRIGDVGGDARVETQGGDVRVNRASAAVTAFTQGGDITLRGVQGGVKAQTAGGDITVELVGKEAGAGSEITTEGGDVTLILPANFRADVLIETKVHDPNGRSIRSEFPELVVVRGPEAHTATGKLGGGGAKVVVRSQSGDVTLKKGPATR